MSDPADRKWTEIPLEEATLLKLALDPNLTVRLNEEQTQRALEIEAEAAMEWLAEWGWECRDCSTRWDPELTFESGKPTNVGIADCPLCGGPPVEA